jgi:hypothetical protein
MKCPSCGLENPPSAQYCDCGHEFVPGSKPTDWTPAQVSEWPGLFTLKHVAQCSGVGVVAVLTFWALSSVVPSVFGVFTVPLWILPAVVGMGAHDNMFLLMFLGGSVFYGTVSFIVLALVIRRKNLKRLKNDNEAR